MVNVIISTPDYGEIENDKLEQLVDMINEVFFASESPLWSNDGSYYRVTKDELNTYIKKGEVRLALLEDKIIGLIKVYEKRPNVGGFGLLMVDPKYSGNRIGSKLVDVAEKWCISKGLDTIELELLVANDFIMEDKVLLTKWYSKIGYVKVEKVPFEILYPSHANLILVPSSFEIMLKTLR